MDHLPLSLLPPQMHPGVAILRHLVPYVGYIGVFIAWGWSAIRSFDKGMHCLVDTGLSLNNRRLWCRSNCYVVAPVRIDTWYLGGKRDAKPERGSTAVSLCVFVTLPITFTKVVVLC